MALVYDYQHRTDEPVTVLAARFGISKQGLYNILRRRGAHPSDREAN